MKTTRRQFLAHTGCGALSAAALLSGLGRFALIDALAQTGEVLDYKALVCIFLFGGNDSNNMVIPYDNYADYNAVRGGTGIQIPQANLLQITPPSAGARFGLHPNLPELQTLWSQQKLAILCNAGTLTRPLTRPEYRAGASRPYQLFSHSDQQTEWQTSFANSPAQTGWGGRLADRTAPISGDGRFPVIASISGVTVFSTGLNTRPIVLSPAPTPLNQTLRLLKTDDRDILLQVLTGEGQDPMPALVQGAARLTSQAINNSLLLNTDPALATVFPNTSLGNQLKQVAKLIKIAPTLGLKRQVFFTSIGGFDTHNNQGALTGQQPNLFTQLSQAMNAFYNASVELGVSAQVTTFTASDFGRTFRTGGDGSGTGSDHGWGSHHFILGDGVRGGEFYGRYPTLALSGPDDTDDGSGARGRWIPTTAVEQYASTLALWYGLSPSDLTLVLPNIGQFPTSNLGFMRP